MTVLLIEDRYFYVRKGDNNTVFPLPFLVITQSYHYNTEYYVILLQKPQKQSLEVLRRCSEKNFANFKRKHLYLESLFNQVACLRACRFIKKRLQQRCFPVKLAKFLRTSIF